MDWVVLTGNSMRPFLSDGDSLGVEWLSANAKYEPALGEIFIARSETGEWIAHRAVGPGLLAKGDASLAWDSFQREQVWGRVVCVKRKSQHKEHAFRVTALDRVICRLSRASMSRSRLIAAAARRALFLAATFRKIGN